MSDAPTDVDASVRAGDGTGRVDDVWIVDALPDAVLVVTPQGTIGRCNARALALLDLGPDAIGRPVAVVLDLRDASGAACPLPTTRPRVGDRLAETVVRVGPAGRPVSLAGRWRDGHLIVTARNAGRREQLDAVQGDVVATVSHEIRSPLTSVKGFTRTLLAKWDRFSDEQKRTMLETIDADADRVTRLLKELLEVSRIDAGRLQLHRTRVDLPQLTERVVAKARVHEDHAGREVTVAVDAELPVVLVDEDKVEQVLTNLVDNALRHAPDGPVEVRVARDHGRLRISVRDHGPGIPADQQRLVFQKFGRGRGVRRTGTGLGLYITRGLVEAHGGRVALDSVEGRGACFHVELPYEPIGV